MESMKANLESSWTDDEVKDLKQKYAQYSAKQLDPRLSSAVIDLLRPQSNAPQKSSKIVIVDSDPAFASQLASQLKQIAAQTTVYADGLAALSGIKKEKPDMIISEILLSKLDGFALCARLRSDDNLKNIPYVFLSDSTAPEHSTKALQLGAEDFLSKSQDSQFIMTKLERMLKKASS